MMKLFQNKKLVFICAIAVMIPPIIIAIFVSLPILPKLTNSNDWIGFWGSYMGSLVGGVVPFIILYITLLNEKKKEENAEKIKCCEKLIDDISTLEGMGRDMVNAVDLNHGSRNDKNFNNKCKEFWVKHNELILYYQCIVMRHNFKGISDFENALKSYKQSIEDNINNAIDKEFSLRKFDDSVLNTIANRDKLLAETRNFIWNNI